MMNLPEIPMQLKFVSGLLSKNAKPAVLISFVYIATKPKQIEIVLPTIKYMFLHKIRLQSCDFFADFDLMVSFMSSIK